MRLTSRSLDRLREPFARLAAARRTSLRVARANGAAGRCDWCDRRTAVSLRHQRHAGALPRAAVGLAEAAVSAHDPSRRTRGTRCGAPEVYWIETIAPSKP